MHCWASRLGFVTAYEDSDRYAELYPELYRLLGRRLRPEDHRVTPQGWALLQHLQLSGPLTVQELTDHIDRAESVVSDVVSTLERAGMLSRIKDPGDRRRTLVWLSDEGSAFLQRQADVLDRERLRRAMALLSETNRRALLDATATLIEAAEAARQQVLAPTADRGGEKQFAPPNDESSKRRKARKKATP